MRATLIWLALAAACAACDREPVSGGRATPAAMHFTDVTAHSGVAMVMTCGRSPSTQIPEVKGGGLALIDHDDDGDLDLFIPNGAYLETPQQGPGARLFANQGALEFADATTSCGIDFHGWGMGVAVGDVDANGHDDLYIAAFGPDALLVNDGHRFADATARAQLGDPRWSTAAAFGDIDLDGDLDLYVVNYVEFDPQQPPATNVFRGNPVFAGPSGLRAVPDVLYANDGNGKFIDISTSAGIDAATPSYGLGLAMLDFNADGRIDIFVGNDSMPDFLWINQGDQKFVEQAVAAGLAFNGDGQAQATMGIAIADVNGDARPDVFTTNFANDTNTMRVSVGSLQYDDRTRQYNLGLVSRPFLSWATMFYDFDHDGDEDLVVFNGHVYPTATFATMDASYRQTPLLFERRGTRFERIEGDVAGAWLAEPHVDRSAAFGDLDSDGDIDIVVGELNGPVRVLENDGARGHWLIVELADRRARIGNRHGVGGKIVLHQDAATQVRFAFGGGSFQSVSTPFVHFGLPSASEVALDITWSDGCAQHIDHVTTDRHLVVERK